MKKLLLTAAVAVLFAAPAMAADMSKSDVDMQAMKMTSYGMAMMDTNKDGMVSKAEHQAAGDKMFMMADSDKNGSVSEQEMMEMKRGELMKMDAATPMKK